MINSFDTLQFSSHVIKKNIMPRSQNTTKGTSLTNVFGNTVSHTNNSSESTELSRLRPRGATTNTLSYTKDSWKPLADNIVYLEREVVATDSLQSFSLLYGCSVNDLKRANNLITEQDFFALRHIKIPVKRYGLLTEPEEELKRRPIASTSLPSSGTSSPLSSASSDFAATKKNKSQVLINDVYRKLDEDLDSTESSERLLRSESVKVSKDVAVANNDAGKYLKKLDKEIRKTVRENDKLDPGKNEVLEEVVSSLGSVGYHPLPLPGSKLKDDCNGADWGMKWWIMLLVFVLFLVLILVLHLKDLIPAFSSKS